MNLQHEPDTQEYIDELDKLIDSIRELKHSLRSGPDRLKHRKEMGRLQGAIDACRFIKRRAERALRKKILSEGGRKIPHGEKAELTPEVVTQAVTLYKDMIESFNGYLSEKNLPPVTPIRPVGSTFYYQEDLDQNSDVVYGDIDYLVSMPSLSSEGPLGQRRKEQARTEREYESHFLDFLKARPPSYVDVKMTGEVSPTMVILELSDGSKVQVDLIATVDEYTDWMQTRWVPERGVKGYVGGNLYKSLGDTLVLTIGDQGVIARIKDGERVDSKNRGKDIEFIQVSKNPNTVFKDIAMYLGVSEDSLSDDLIASPGINEKEISIEDIASGIRMVSDNLERNNLLPERFNSSFEMLEEVLARFKLLLDATVSKKSKPSAAQQSVSEDYINSLVKMNSEQYNNVKNEFGI
tara:strand:+ start:312 stop:1535 length:1224 start_codon:yes stop_codon:yes gene_type:complete